MDQLLFCVIVLGLSLLCFAGVGRSMRKERESQARHQESAPPRVRRNP